MAIDVDDMPGLIPWTDVQKKAYEWSRGTNGRAKRIYANARGNPPGNKQMLGLAAAAMFLAGHNYPFKFMIVWDSLRPGQQDVVVRFIAETASYAGLSLYMPGATLYGGGTPEFFRDKFLEKLEYMQNENQKQQAERRRADESRAEVELRKTVVMPAIEFYAKRRVGEIPAGALPERQDQALIVQALEVEGKPLNVKSPPDVKIWGSKIAVLWAALNAAIRYVETGQYNDAFTGDAKKYTDIMIDILGDTAYDSDIETTDPEKTEKPPPTPPGGANMPPAPITPGQADTPPTSAPHAAQSGSVWPWLAGALLLMRSL